MGKQRQSLIENGFPFEQLSIIAEQESWRKEVNRPAAYIHKWWARRLGSVFRGLIIGGFEKEGADFFSRFYGSTSYRGKVILDPFMGSGTTIHEAIKLGATAIGSDINPVASTIVRAAVDIYDREEVLRTFKEIEKHCREKIQKYYKAPLNGELLDVLYYFWVKVITCDNCGTIVPLTKSSIFSKNAYVSKKPEAKSLCPKCGHINTVLYNDVSTECEECHTHYNPQEGNVQGNDYICPVCGKRERIVDYMRRRGKIAEEKMYAKMVIDRFGHKEYVSIDSFDLRLYAEAHEALSEYEEYIPADKIHEGINTNQILNYQYRHWREMFNDRQLLSFGILTKEILAIQDLKMRRLFAVLMSGTLEFNNMFCSFKGEGTGAVRPLFYNHILKNELMPLEANPWGSKSSSGSFSTLFENRIIRMLDYKENPFELRTNPEKRAEKVYLASCKDQAKVDTAENMWVKGNALILCRDSAHINIPSESVDLVVTDPPFFDNVNYSELADFFYVWLKKFDIGIGGDNADSTRVAEEVQDSQQEKFEKKLANVFVECNRVLKQKGILLFTYHHSRTDGWLSVYNAINYAGFSIAQVIPVKSEMAVSVAIMAAKEPINYDLVFVCKKKPDNEQIKLPVDTDDCFRNGIKRILESGLTFSCGDRLILKYGLALKQLSESGKQTVTKADIEEIVKSFSDEL